MWAAILLAMCTFPCASVGHEPAQLASCRQVSIHPANQTIQTPGGPRHFDSSPSGSGSNRRAPVAVTTFGDLAYDPVLLRRFQDAALSNSLPCPHPVLVDGTWRFCTRVPFKSGILHTVIRMRGELFLRTSECSIDRPSGADQLDPLKGADTFASDANQESAQPDKSFLVIAVNDQLQTALAMLQHHNPGVVHTVAQMLVVADVCTPSQPKHPSRTAWVHDREGRQLADRLCSVQRFAEGHGFSAMQTQRVSTTFRSPKLPDTLLIAGFPREVCRYNMLFAKDGRAHRDNSNTILDTAPDVHDDDSHTETSAVAEAMRTIVLDHIHDCSEDHAFILPPSARSRRLLDDVGSRAQLHFPGANRTRQRVSWTRSGAEECLARCWGHDECKAFAWWEGHVTWSMEAGLGRGSDGRSSSWSGAGGEVCSGGAGAGAQCSDAGPAGEGGVCVGCREARWAPLRQRGGATGVLPRRLSGAAQREQSSPAVAEAFFLRDEPRGGWTLTDATGFAYSSDDGMLAWSWAGGVDGGGRDFREEGEPRVGVEQSGPSDAAPGAEEDAGEGPGRGACAGRPGAAVVYLVGYKEEDMAALEVSLRSVEANLLRGQALCYPVLLFREAWDAELRRRIRGWLGAGSEGGPRASEGSEGADAAGSEGPRVEFLVAAMGFPAGFDAARHSSQQSKRSAWGYQHMSRFWLRGIFEHPRVRELEYYLRLDTDSVLTSPVLDIFLDAKERGIAYGYRQAGKDWIGRNKGLWTFHAQYVASSGRRNMSLPMQLALEHPVGDQTEAPIFYTNLELVHIPTFLSGELWEYALAVDASHGIYLHNWGDAQLRWLQVATFLPVHSVHRYCHFGYLHAAAAMAPFECWRDPWVGYNCPAPLCDWRGHPPERLTDPATAQPLLAPAIRPGSPLEVQVSVLLPSGCAFAGLGAVTSSFRAFWAGAASKGRHEESEVVAAEFGGDDGEEASFQLRLDGTMPFEPFQVAALVVELDVRFRDFSWEGAGAYSEQFVLAFPSELGGWAGERAEGVEAAWEAGGRLQVWLQRGVGGSLPRARPGAGERSGEQAVSSWQSALKYALLAEEYVSRHLRGKELPEDVQHALLGTHLLDVPVAARGVIFHTIVLCILNAPGALSSLERLLQRFSRRGFAFSFCADGVLLPRVPASGADTGVRLQVEDRGCSAWVD